MEKTNLSKQLSIHSLFKNLSDSFINIFVPILILQQINYKMTIIYLILLELFSCLALFVFNKLIKNKPLLSITLHIIFSILSYILLSIFELNTFTILINAILQGISKSLYFTSIYIIISKNKSGSGFSLTQIFKSVGTIIITLFNGYILNLNLSFSILLTCLISLILYIISIIPFFLIKNKLKIEKTETIKYKEILTKTKNYNIFNILFGIQDLFVGYLIPLLLIILNISVDKVAIVIAIINVVKILITLLSNKMYKSNKSFLAILIGSIIFTISSILLLIIKNNIFYYTLTILLSICFPFFYITTCNEYTKQTQSFITDSFLLREIMVHILRPIILIPFIFLNDLKIFIYLAIFVTILMPIFGYKIFNKKRVD